MGRHCIHTGIGGFLLLGGRLDDLFGRKRWFIIAVVLFGLASLVTGLAVSDGMLIAARAVQGLAGALLTPSALSIVLVSYAEGHRRNVALSAWGIVASAGGAVGALLGGVLTQFLNWRCFFINCFCSHSYRRTATTGRTCCPVSSCWASARARYSVRSRSRQPPASTGRRPAWPLAW
ncbi:MFS transporter [Streptomyces sp. NPDC006706]|uniref:MFS transporter n=1 Tax=Streptomyces sp. NPDC006706 TaxID=3364761 RepID=UPI003682560E